MELTSKNGFTDLSSDEIRKVEGGVFPLIPAILGGGKLVLEGVGFGLGYYSLKKIFG